jgi:FKBP-type peptidyl-prolyl cis-trans isomerase SlpA
MTITELRKVRHGDTLVLHYKLSALDGTEIDNTFGGAPLTLRLGHNEFAANLEQWLIGLHVGEHHEFHLQPWAAFGASDPALIQEIALEEFPPGMPIEENSLIEFSMPNGTTVAGLIKARTASHALVDFNHPLSGCPVLFEVEVVEILE